MGLITDTLARLGLIQRAANPQAPAPAAGIGTSARPTYATGLYGAAIIARPESFRLLEQFYRTVPVVPRSIDILAGFVGCPRLEVEGNTKATDELQEWARRVEYGRIGRGLHPWLRDHLGQALLYGFAVGEAEVNATRDEVVRLWAYRSPYFGFRTNALGELDLLQRGVQGVERVLDPVTYLHTVHNPQGCDPNGQSLYQSTLNYCQAWVDMVHMHRQEWKRTGARRFHLHYKPPATLNDPNGTITQGIKAAMEAAWNKAMKASAVDGQVEDYFSVGDECTITTIGLDGKPIDIAVSKRAVVEEIVTATGIPAWMLGYSWSSTERLSTQQADMLLATVDCLRSMCEGTVRKAVDLRQRLAGRREALQYRFVWPDVNLQDRRETAFAEHFSALALRSRQTFARQAWADGWFDQKGAAEYVTGSDEIATPQEAPVPLPVAAGEASADGAPGGTGADALTDPDAAEKLAEGSAAAALAELKAVTAEYGAVFNRSGCC